MAGLCASSKVGICIGCLAQPSSACGFARGCHWDEVAVGISPGLHNAETHVHAHGYGCVREILRAHRVGPARHRGRAHRGSARRSGNSLHPHERLHPRDIPARASLQFSYTSVVAREPVGFLPILSSMQNEGDALGRFTISSPHLHLAYIVHMWYVFKRRYWSEPKSKYFYLYTVVVNMVIITM